jgi:hypothetical protein
MRRVIEIGGTKSKTITHTGLTLSCQRAYVPPITNTRW